MNNLATFTPLVITVETIQMLSKEEKYSDLLSLYMAYVEITTWQNNNSIKATREFMMKRLGWGNIKFNNAKAKLTELNLVENIERKDKEGKITGHYVLVKHIIKPQGGFHHQVDSSTTNANDLQESANDSKISSTSAKKSKYSDKQKSNIKQVYIAWLHYMVLSPEQRLIDEPDSRKALIQAAATRCKLTDTRKTKINARVASMGLETVVTAIAGLSQSDWHRGENDSKWIAKLEWLCEKDEKIEEWANKYEGDSR